jgi:hypothetical protein
VHSEICAVPFERLEKERELMGVLPSLRAQIGKLVVRKVDRLSCVRFGSARYSVPTSTSGARSSWWPKTAGSSWSSWARSWPPTTSLPLVRRRSRRALWRAPAPAHPGGAAQDASREGLLCPRSGGRVLHQGCRRHGMTSLKGDLDELAQMEAAHGKEILLAALERAVAFSRFRAHDVRSIIARAPGSRAPPRRVRRSSSSSRSSRCGRCLTTPLENES